MKDCTSCQYEPEWRAANPQGEKRGRCRNSEFCEAEGNEAPPLMEMTPKGGIYVYDTYARIENCPLWQEPKR